MKASVHETRAGPQLFPLSLPGYRCGPIDDRAGWCQHFLREKSNRGAKGHGGMKIHHCNERQQETRAVPASSTSCLQALSRALWQPDPGVGKAPLREQGLGAGGRLSSFTTDRWIVSGGRRSLPERWGTQFLDSSQMQAHLYWPMCVLQAPLPRVWGLGVGGSCGLPIGIQERPPVSFPRRKSNPLTFGVAKLGVFFVDRKKAQ